MVIYFLAKFWVVMSSKALMVSGGISDPLIIACNKEHLVGASLVCTGLGWRERKMKQEHSCYLWEKRLTHEFTHHCASGKGNGRSFWERQSHCQGTEPMREPPCRAGVCPLAPCLILQSFVPWTWAMCGGCKSTRSFLHMGEGGKVFSWFCNDLKQL